MSAPRRQSPSVCHQSCVGRVDLDAARANDVLYYHFAVSIFEFMVRASLMMDKVKLDKSAFICKIQTLHGRAVSHDVNNLIVPRSVCISHHDLSPAICYMYRNSNDEQM